MQANKCIQAWCHQLSAVRWVSKLTRYIKLDCLEIYCIFSGIRTTSKLFLLYFFFLLKLLLQARLFHSFVHLLLPSFIIFIYLFLHVASNFYCYTILVEIGITVTTYHWNEILYRRWWQLKRHVNRSSSFWKPCLQFINKTLHTFRQLT